MGFFWNYNYLTDFLFEGFNVDSLTSNLNNYNKF